MRHLYCAATEMEMRGVFPFLQANLTVGSVYVLDQDAYLITGLGQLQTSIHLGQVLFSLRPHAIIQVGICGAYDLSQSPLGQGIWIKSDSLADFGAEDDQIFLTSKELAWAAQTTWDFLSPFDLDTWNESERMRLNKLMGPFNSATVDRCTGSISTAQSRQNRGFQIENMEGAALAALAQTWTIPAVQIRAVSNLASIRDFSLWQIPRALQTLKEILHG